MIQDVKNTLRSWVLWSQQYARTDMLYVARGGTWVTVGHIGGMALSFLLAVFFANFTSRELYGSYKFVLAAVSVLGALSLSGLSSAAIQAVARGHEGTIGRAMRLQWRWSWILTLAGTAAAAYYAYHSNFTLAFSFAAAALILPLTSTLNIAGGFYAGKKLFREGTAISLASQACTVVAVAAAVLIWRSVTATVLAYFAGSLIGAALTYGYMRYRLHPNHTVDEYAIAFGRHLSFMSVISVAAVQADKLWVFHGAGAAPLALYAFAIAFPEQIRGIMKSFLNIAVPKFSTTPSEDLRGSILDKTLRLTAAAVLAVAAYWVAAPYLYRLFFPAYLDAVMYSRIYALGLILIPGITLFGTGIFVRRQTKRMYMLRLIPDIVALALAATLIPRYGIWGAVAENTITWSMLFILSALLFLYERGARSRSK